MMKALSQITNYDSRRALSCCVHAGIAFNKLASPSLATGSSFPRRHKQLTASRKPHQWLADPPSSSSDLSSTQSGSVSGSSVDFGVDRGGDSRIDLP